MRLLIIALLMTVGVFMAPAEDKISQAIADAEKVLNDGQQEVMHDYRAAMAKVIGLATKVEVYLLDFEMTPVEGASNDSVWAIRLDEDQFPIIPYGKRSSILQRKVLTADEVKLLLPVVQNMMVVKENTGGAMCHYPIHGIRIWGGDELLFQTSLCYRCDNFYMPFPHGGAEWTSIHEQLIAQVMEQFIPIPPAQMKRFNEMHKGE